MEYYYDKYNHVWVDVDRKRVSPDKARSLREARKNNRYIILENREGRCKFKHFPGLDADTLFYEISDFKLLLDGGEKILVSYYGPNWKSTSKIDSVDIKNKKILEKLEEDLSYVVDFVEDVSYLGPHSKTLADAVRNNNYWSLSEAAKLYYQLEGNYNFF